MYRVIWQTRFESLAGRKIGVPCTHALPSFRDDRPKGRRDLCNVEIGVRLPVVPPTFHPVLPRGAGRRPSVTNTTGSSDGQHLIRLFLRNICGGSSTVEPRCATPETGVRSSFTAPFGRSSSANSRPPDSQSGNAGATPAGDAGAQFDTAARASAPWGRMTLRRFLLPVLVEPGSRLRTSMTAFDSPRGGRFGIFAARLGGERLS